MGSAVSDKSTVLDRRAFISRLCSDTTALGVHGEIASILVQTRPERLVEVERSILGLAGCEVHGRDTKGKLVVVIDAGDAGIIGSTLNMIATTEGVVSAALVFHAVDAAWAFHPDSAP